MCVATTSVASGPLWGNLLALLLPQFTFYECQWLFN